MALALFALVFAACDHKDDDTTTTTEAPPPATEPTRPPPPATTRPPPPPQDGQPYVVRRGDTLSAISRTACGRSGAWPSLFAANEGVAQTDGAALVDPHLIEVGWVLDIDCDAPVDVVAAEPAAPAPEPDALEEAQALPELRVRAPARTTVDLRARSAPPAGIVTRAQEPTPLVSSTGFPAVRPVVYELAEDKELPPVQQSVGSTMLVDIEVFGPPAGDVFLALRRGDDGIIPITDTTIDGLRRLRLPITLPRGETYERGGGGPGAVAPAPVTVVAPRQPTHWVRSPELLEFAGYNQQTVRVHVYEREFRAGTTIVEHRHTTEVRLQDGVGAAVLTNRTDASCVLVDGARALEDERALIAACG